MSIGLSRERSTVAGSLHGKSTEELNMDVVDIEVRHAGQRLAVRLALDLERGTLKLLLADGRSFAASGEDLWAAFMQLRDAMPEYVFQCQGARLNVHPSGMARQMASGLLAYELVMGQQARRADLVQVFDPAEVTERVSPAQQEQFFREWIASLRG